MVYRTYRRRTAPMRRMRRTANRRRPLYRAPRKKLRNKLHYAQFRIQDDQAAADIFNNVIANNPVVNSNHFAYTLDQFPHSNCFVRMYNQYRISKIKVQFIPVNSRAQITDAQVGADSNVPTFAAFVNRTATTFPTNLAQILSVPGAKQVNAGRFVQLYFSPVTYDSVYRALPATTNALNPEYNQWIRTSESNVKHHGISWVMSEAGSNWAREAFRYRVVTTIYAQFKGQKVDTTL